MFLILKDNCKDFLREIKKDFLNKRITSTNDWASTIDNALNNCIKNKPNSQNLGIDSLLNVGCRKVVLNVF